VLLKSWHVIQPKAKNPLRERLLSFARNAQEKITEYGIKTPIEKSHIGFYLMDAGRSLLEKKC
jgi:hypothetical protein